MKVALDRRLGLDFFEETLLITTVRAGSAAEDAGIKKGWTLVRIEGTSVRNVR